MLLLPNRTTGYINIKKGLKSVSGYNLLVEKQRIKLLRKKV